jgi:hypothetical protein
MITSSSGGGLDGKNISTARKSPCYGPDGVGENNLLELGSIESFPEKLNIGGVVIARVHQGQIVLLDQVNIGRIFIGQENVDGIKKRLGKIGHLV